MEEGLVAFGALILLGFRKKKGSDLQLLQSKYTCTML
jgi:hypothetical protein